MISVGWLLDVGTMYFGDHALGGDAPDFIGLLFGEPQVAIRSGRDAVRSAADTGVEARGDRILDNRPTGSDSADLARLDLGKPQRSVGSHRDALRPGANGR